MMVNRIRVLVHFDTVAAIPDFEDEFAKQAKIVNFTPVSEAGKGQVGWSYLLESGKFPESNPGGPYPLWFAVFRNRPSEKKIEFLGFYPPGEAQKISGERK